MLIFICMCCPPGVLNESINTAGVLNMGIWVLKTVHQKVVEGICFSQFVSVKQKSRWYSRLPWRPARRQRFLLHAYAASQHLKVIQHAATAGWNLIFEKTHWYCFSVSAVVQLWALYQIGCYGNRCCCGALWLAACERTLYLDRAEARAWGVNAHWCKQQFWQVSLTGEATESLVCVC